MLEERLIRLQFNKFRRQFFMLHRLNGPFKRIAGGLLLFLLASGFQQEVQGQVQLNSGDRYDLLHAGLGLSTRGLPVYVGVEQTLDKHLSAALMASFQSYGENGTAGSWTHQYFGLGLQGNYHFVELDVKDLDLFAGLTLGWYAHRYKWAGVGVAPGNYGGNALGGFQLAGQIGARYALDDWTLMAQLNGGLLLSGFMVGLSFPL